jgi:SAM-dependent methyltransferase
MSLGRHETVRYHEEFYARHELFEAGSWLHRPSPFVLRSLEHLDVRGRVLVLDLGCGVGRHTLPIAGSLPPGSYVVGVDLIPYAAERLKDNAAQAQLASAIQPVVADLDTIGLAPRSLDLLVSVSALEHVPGLEALESVLQRCRDATKPSGLHALIIGTDKVEIDARGGVRPARVEFHLPTEDAKSVLERVYGDWEWIEYSEVDFGVEEDRDGESYTLRTTNLRLLARAPESPDSRG